MGRGGTAGQVLTTDGSASGVSWSASGARWADSDDNSLLEPSGSETGIEVTDVNTDNLTDNGSGQVTLGNTLDLNSNNVNNASDISSPTSDSTDDTHSALTISTSTTDSFATTYGHLTLNADTGGDADHSHIKLSGGASGANMGDVQVTAGSLDVQTGTIENTTGALTVQTSSGNLTLNPSNDIDATGAVALLQNGSGSSLPGTSTNGQIRLFDDTDAADPSGRLQFQANGTTFTVNADAGHTYRDEIAFAATMDQEPLGPDETRCYVSDEPFEVGDSMIQHVDHRVGVSGKGTYGEIHTVPMSLDSGLERSALFEAYGERVEALEAELDTKDHRIDRLEANVDRKDERIAELEERLDELERTVATHSDMLESNGGTPTAAD